MFPFVFLTLLLSSPFTLQIVAFFRQEQPAASSHKGNQGGWGKRVVETNSFAIGLLPPYAFKFSNLLPQASWNPSILKGESGPHTLLVQLASFSPIPPRGKRRGSARHGASPRGCTGDQGAGGCSKDAAAAASGCGK